MFRTPGTEGFALNQTMLRIRDPGSSLAFYRDVLGMTLLQQLDFADMRFSLYFLAYLGEAETVPADPAERARFIFTRETTLELTHNWGTESDPAFGGYHSGNDDPRGFGHIGISVPDVAAACAVRGAGRAVQEAPAGRDDEGHRLHYRPRRLLGRNPVAIGDDRRGRRGGLTLGKVAGRV